MKAEDLVKAGYRLENMKITSVDLSMQDHGCITLMMDIRGSSVGTIYGGICLGHGYLGAKEFSGSEKAMPYIMRIMDVVGVERFNDLKGKYIRIATKTISSPVKIIGNIVEDKWFDSESFFNE